MFSKNISTFLDVISNASADAKDNDNTNHDLKKLHDINQMLSNLRSANPSNFCYLNINSVRNNFTDFQEIINGNVDIVSITDSSSLSTQFVLERHQ